MSSPRLFYNNDASFLHYSSPPMTTDDFVYETVGRFAGTQVDALVCHMFGFGPATPLYPTEVPEARGIDFEQVDFVSVWRQQEILKRFWADPWKELGDMETLKVKDKQYMVAGGHATVKQFPHERLIFEAFRHQLPLLLEEQPTGSGQTISFTVGDDLEMAANRGILEAVILELAIVGLTSEDLFEFKLNGKSLPERPHLELHPPHYRAGYGHTASNGHYLLRYDLRSRDWIRKGSNALDLALRRRNPKVRVEFGIHDLKLDINYRILPVRG